MKDVKKWLEKQCPKNVIFFDFTCKQCKNGFPEVYGICKMQGGKKNE